MLKLEAFTQENWSKGLNRSRSDFEITDNELWTAENCLLDSAMIAKRKGYAKLNTVALDTPNVLSVFVFGSYILANCGTKIYSITTTGTVAEVVTGLTAGYAVSYAVYDGVCYMTNGKDRPWKWNGVDAATQLADALPKAKWFIVFRDKLFYVATIANPNYVYFSQAGVPETIDADAYFIVYTDDNQDLTGVAALFGYILFFKESSVQRMQGATKQQLLLESNLFNLHPRIGAVSMNSIVYVPSGVMFLSNDGVYFTNTEVLTKQSVKVSHYLDLIVNTYKSTSAAFWDGKRCRFSYATGANATPNESLVLGLDLGYWSLFTYGMNAYSVALDGTIYAASNAGQVYKIDSGYSDDGSDIKMLVETGVRYSGTPYEVKIYRKAGLHIVDGNGTINMKFIVDRGAQDYTKAIAAAADTYSIFSLPKNLKGRNIQVQFEEDADDTYLSLSAFDVRFLPTLGER